MIRLKVVKVKNLASLVCGSPLGWARSSLQIFFSQGFFLSIEYCSAYFRFGSSLLLRFGLSQYRLHLYFSSSSTGVHMHQLLIEFSARHPSWLLRLRPITFSVLVD